MVGLVVRVADAVDIRGRKHASPSQPDRSSHLYDLRCRAQRDPGGHIDSGDRFFHDCAVAR